MSCSYILVSVLSKSISILKQIYLVMKFASVASIHLANILVKKLISIVKVSDSECLMRHLAHVFS